MKALALIVAALALSACASEASGDIATYDVLKTARADCVSQGGELILKKDGNPERLSAYECARKPAK